MPVLACDITIAELSGNLIIDKILAKSVLGIKFNHAGEDADTPNLYKCYCDSFGVY